MAIFGKSRKREDTAPYPREFVGLVVAVDDTPTLIRRIAEHQHYMAFCSAAVKAEQNTDPLLLRFYHELKADARRQNISFDRIREKLAPVAAALGLHIITPDAIQADYYRILGVSKDVDAAAIKKAYRNKALTAHPDTAGSGGDLFLAVHEAYNVLSDATLRRQYDLSRRQSDHRQWREDNQYPEGDVHDAAPPAFRRNVNLFILILCVLAGIAVLVDHEMRQRSLYSSDYAAPVAINRTMATGKTGIEKTDEKNMWATLDKNNNGEYKAGDIQTEGLPEADLSKAVIVPLEVIADTASSRPLTAARKKPPEDPKVDRAKPVSKIPPPPVMATAPSPVVFHKNMPPPAPAAPAVPATVTVPAVASTRDKEESLFVSLSGPTTPIVERGLEKNNDDMRENLERFLVQYCKAYEGRDLDRFIAFFEDDATENGKSMSDLLSQYRENFRSLAFIQYRIETLGYHWDVTQNRVRMDGEFVLKWIKNGEKKRHQYHGAINMKLIPEKDSFRIRELRYEFINK
jgi:curved DNA-binding protein CbpA